MTTCRLIIDPPQSGPWNMAVDELLLHEAAKSGQPTLRLYAWSEPTLSLGYFQRYAERLTHAASLERPVVRRPSGGGAILHDRELTYSLAVPATHRLARQPNDLYRQVHAALADALQSFGISTSVYEATLIEDQAFLCFQRRATGDLLAGSSKIAGGAQRRYRGAVLQHGSILLGRSAYAPELPGLSEIHHRPLTRDDLTDPWLEALRQRLGVEIIEASPDRPDFERAAERLACDKFAADAWIRRR